MWGITGSFSLSQIDPLGIWVFWQSPLFWFQGKGNDLELVWMGWVLSDITQFSISIIQIVWVQLMSICLDEFWIIVSITLSDELWKLKTHFRCFQFQSSIFNGIFVIKLTYPATMFDKQIFFFFFFGETQPQLLKLKTGSELRCQTGGLENLGILSDE